MATLTRIAITGADGFLGWHIRAYLHQFQTIEVRPVVEADFATPEALAVAIGQADVVFHLAGMNRGPETEVYDTNIRLAHTLTTALETLALTPVVVFANSTHSTGDSAFGRSKREASAHFTAWAKTREARYLDLVLPHLFGEGGRPFYNSGFATFCHQLATGGEPQIVQDGQLELIHAQRLAAQVLALVQDPSASGQVRITGTPMRVSEALERLTTLHRTYAAGIIPDLADPLALEFFNTYRSYLYPSGYPVALMRHSDARGDLVEAVKANQGGQSFLSTTHPGITRGRHYHYRKVERFLVVSGQAEIRIRRLLDPEVRTFRVQGSEPGYIDIPTLHTHEITNVGDSELLTLFWSHEIFDPANPDTYPEPVTLQV